MDSPDRRKDGAGTAEPASRVFLFCTDRFGRAFGCTDDPDEVPGVIEHWMNMGYEVESRIEGNYTLYNFRRRKEQRPPHVPDSGAKKRR